MGILNEIPKQTTYTKLSLNGLEQLIKNNLFNIKDSEIVIYTGLYGMYMFDLCMMGFGLPIVYYTFGNKHRKNTKLIILNLFEKSGFIKAVINTKTRKVEIRKGTIIIKEAFNFDELEEYLTNLSPKYHKEFITKKGITKYYK